MKTCVHCGESVPDTRKTCLHCRKALPVVEKVVELCCACKKPIDARQLICPHCGDPEPRHASAQDKRIMRCTHCHHVISRRTIRCPKCKATRETSADGLGITAPSDSLAVPPTHQRARTADASSTRRRSGQTREVRCDVCGSPLTLGSRRCARCEAPSGGKRSTIKSATAQRGGRGEPDAAAPAPEAAAGAPTPSSPPNAERASSPCTTCGTLVQAGVKPCPRCQASDPSKRFDDEWVETESRWKMLASKPVIAIVTVALVVAAALSFRASLVESDNDRRIWRAFGDGASEERVNALKTEAAEIGVSSNTMIKVRFICLGLARLRPSTDELSASAQAAEAQGLDRDAAVLAFVGSRCRR